MSLSNVISKGIPEDAAAAAGAVDLSSQPLRRHEQAEQDRTGITLQRLVNKRLKERWSSPSLPGGGGKGGRQQLAGGQALLCGY